MRKITLRLALGILLVLFGVTLTIAKERIKFAFHSDPTAQIQVYGIETGKVKSETIEVEISRLDIAAIIQATGTKEYDVIEGSVLGLPMALKRGLKLIIVGTAIQPRAGQFIIVKKGSPITAPQQLRGKTVAVSALGSTVVAQMRLALRKKYGLNTDLKKGDVKWIQAPLPTLPTLVYRGKVDAAYVIHIASFLATKSDRFAIIEDTVKDYRESFGRYPVSSIFVTYPEKIRAKGQALREFMRMLRASVKYAQEHPQEVYSAVAKRYGVNEDFLKTYWRKWYRFSADVQKEDLKDIARLWQAAKEAGILSKYPEIEKVVWQ